MPRGRSKQPKAYSNRTDLNGPVAAAAPKGMPYGESKKLMDAQKAVPVAAQDVPAPPESAPSAQPPMASMPPVKPIPLTAETQRPMEDVLTGMTESRSDNPDIQRMKALQPMFEAEALSPDAPETFRQFVTWLRSQ